MGKTKILIADNQSVIRIGLQSMIERSGEFAVVGEADEVEAIIPLIRKHTPEIVILDTGMPRTDMKELIASMKKVHPAIRILVYTNEESERAFFQAFHGGAHGYLLKTSQARSVIDALNALKEGELFFGPRISELMLKQFLAKSEKPAPQHAALTGNLTKREVEILTLIALGMTNKEIASQLFISSLTVHTHRSNLLKKLNVRGTAQLVRCAIDLGLVTPRTEQPTT